MQLKPIPTNYNGNSFRSKIEARWALFFDTLNIKYKYELEGYDLEGLYYLPDFWLPDLNMFVEIKGLPMNETDRQKVKRLSKISNKKVLILTGSIPSFEDFLSNEYETECYLENEGWDNNYFFCECEDCGAIGVEFEGRSDRMICKSHKCSKSYHGDKGYNCISERLVTK